MRITLKSKFERRIIQYIQIAKGNWIMKASYVLSFIILFAMSSFPLLATERYAEEYEIASRHRSYPVTVWCREVLKFVPHYNVGTKADIKVCLHHLAGNVMHIVKMYATDDKYFQEIRRREMSQTVGINIMTNEPVIRYVAPDDIVAGRNSKTDLTRIVGLLQRWETLERASDAMQQFCREVRLAKQETEGYRMQRKTSFRVIRIANPEKAGHDDDIPDSVILNVLYPKCQRRFMEGE